LNSETVYKNFSNRFSITEQELQLEQDQQEERRNEVAAIPTDSQAQFCMNQYLEFLENPPAESERFERKCQILDLMTSVGRPMVDLILKSLAASTDSRLSEDGFEMMEVIQGAEIDSDATMHRELASLLVQYCEHNTPRGSEQWQKTPAHIATTLSVYYQGYPYPKMGGKCELIDHEKFVAIAKDNLEKPLDQLELLNR